MNIMFRKYYTKSSGNTQISQEKKQQQKNKFKANSRLRNINGCGVC